jgi:glycosyltransferase involved in cell wall biosynthesis
VVIDQPATPQRPRTHGPRCGVLIIVQNLPVPFDRRVWLECQALVDDGFTVSVICPKGPNDPSFDVVEGVSLYKFRPYAPGGGKLGFIGEYIHSFLVTAWLTLKVRRSNKFHILQACNPPDIFWPIAGFWKLVSGVRFVFDHHDLCPELYESRFPTSMRLPYWGLRALEKATHLSADHVIATNDSYRNIAINRSGKSPRDVTVVRSGPDLNRLRRCEPEPERKRGHRYLAAYLGVMGPQDGVDNVVRAADVIVNQLHRTDIGFTLIGSGDCFDELVALRDELGLQDHVHFTGRVSDDELARIMSSADVGLSPDPKNPLNDASTMNKTVEYMAFGLPVVAFELHETRVSAGSAALYATPGNVEEFATTIASLLDDEPRRVLMSRESNFRIETQLAWHHQRDKYVGVYRALLPEPEEITEITLPDTERSEQLEVIDLTDTPYPQEIDLSQVH